MARFEINYDFEEVTLPQFGKGMFLDGTAVLADDDSDGEFFISEIVLDGHALDRRDRFEAELFKKIATAIYSDDEASRAYADAWRDRRETMMESHDAH